MYKLLVPNDVESGFFHDLIRKNVGWPTDGRIDPRFEISHPKDSNQVASSTMYVSVTGVDDGLFFIVMPKI